MIWALMACVYAGSGECNWQAYHGLEYDKRELCEAAKVNLQERRMWMTEGHVGEFECRLKNDKS